MGAPMNVSMDSLKWSASHSAGSSAGLHRGCSGAGPSHRGITHTRCGAHPGAEGQSRSGRAPEPVRAATVEAPKVTEGGHANKQGDIREQAHRRGIPNVHYLDIDISYFTFTLYPMLQLASRWAHPVAPAKEACISLMRYDGSTDKKILSILMKGQLLSIIPCAAPLDKGHLFQAKYVPFKAVMEGDPWKSEESYSLDEVIYR